MDTSVFYSINVSLSPSEFPTRVGAISEALTRINVALSQFPKIKTTLFLDVFMLLRIGQRYPEHYEKIQKALNTLYKNGHDLGIFINMVWQNTDDLHKLDIDSILDSFVCARDEILKIMSFESKQQIKRVISIKEKVQTKTIPELSVRVANGKLQPFVHLQDAYKFVNIKIDSSVLPKQTFSSFYNYKKVAPGRVYRFSKDPAQGQRFGQFLSLPRCLFPASSFWCFKTDRLLKKHIKKYKTPPVLFIDTEANLSYTPISVYKKNNLFILSPDLITTPSFVTTVRRAGISQNGIISVESFLTTISQLSFENLKSLIRSNMSFSKVSDIIKTFGVSTNNVLLK